MKTKIGGGERNYSYVTSNGIGANALQANQMRKIGVIPKGSKNDKTMSSNQYGSNLDS